MNKRLLKRFLIFILSGLAFLSVLSLILFNIYKDDIAKFVLLQTNQLQEGEIIFDDIAIAPFVHFPDVSVELNELRYFEKSSVYREFDSIPIVKLEKLYLAFDVMDLVKGDVNVTKVRIENGKVNIVSYTDSTINLVNAIGLHQDTTLVAKDSISNQESDLILDISHVVVHNVDVAYTNSLLKTKSEYTVNSAKASLNYWPDTIKCALASDIVINELAITEQMSLTEKKIGINTSLRFGRDSRTVYVDPSDFSFESASFTTTGFFNLGSTGDINLSVKGNDKDFSLLNIFLSAEGVENVQKGDLYFAAEVVGSFDHEIPAISCSFGLKDVEIEIPNTNKRIHSFNLNGTFQSGNNSDFSQATLDITDLSAKLPGGNVKGMFNASNFTAPNLDLDLYLKGDVTGFDRVFNVGIVDSLTGRVEMKTNLKGKYNPSTGKFSKDYGNSVIRFDSVSFVIPDVNRIKNIYGRVRIKNDSIVFKDLNLGIGTSDFNINGSLTNGLYAFFTSEKPIDGRLHIKSGVYDFPDFFSWDTKIATAFPYRIKNINLFVRPTTTTRDLYEFVKAPKIDFLIEHLDAEIEDFLPPVTIRSGLFLLGDQDSSLLLDFKDFDIELAGCKLQTDMIYHSPPGEPDWFTIDVGVSNLNPKLTFSDWFADSVPEYLDGKLDGNIHFEMALSNDSLMEFDKIDFKAFKLDYVNAKDTFDIHQMRVDAKDVDYDLEKSSDFLENLSFEMNLTADTFATNYFRLDEVNDHITANKGEFHIIPQNAQFFDKLAKGDVLLRPYHDPPTYEFRYDIQQFDVARLFDTFLEDTVLTGKMDLSFELILAGAGWEEVKNNLNGYINVYGKDLTMHGLDLDKLIDRFKRSQRFTFADLGAVLLMGPAGILVTKGSDYASILILNHGEMSEVGELSSQWDIKNGVVELSDVAFATNQNRMAANGIIDLGADTLALEIALVNKEGCLVFGQTLNGEIKDPDMGKVKVIKSLFAPVTNLAKSTSDSDCDVFYNGKVKQPESK